MQRLASDSAGTAILASTATSWLGTARMPRDLAHAGFRVVLVAPEGSLARSSRYVHRLHPVSARTGALAWIDAFADAVLRERPRIVLPCDDTAFGLLQQIVAAPPRHLDAARQLDLAALVVRSLGDPAHYAVSVDKTRVCAAAEAAGVRVPPYHVVETAAAALEFARIHGWPVVLKRAQSSAGEGVAICTDSRALARAFEALPGAATSGLQAMRPRLVVQGHIHGRTRYFAGTAWQGSLLCGYAVDKLAGEARGAASVVRYFRCDALEASAATLASVFGASGIFAPEYIVDERTGDAYLVEINRRVTPGTHRGAFIGMSSAVALAAALGDMPSPQRTRLDDNEVHVYVSFPHEWLRDPGSPYLRDHPVDVPWDEPGLMAAMLALRRGR